MTDHHITPATAVEAMPLYDPAQAEVFPELKHMLEAMGGCDHEVGICYCDVARELEAAEIIVKGMMATASMGFPSHRFLEETRKAVAALRSLGVPERTEWGVLLMWQARPVLDVPEVDNDGNPVEAAPNL